MSLSARRAWIEIPYTRKGCGSLLSSLSARRAWIEIVMPFFAIFWSHVALRKESVDRNRGVQRVTGLPSVALRKESVDRNPLEWASQEHSTGRSPQGERG